MLSITETALGTRFELFSNALTSSLASWSAAFVALQSIDLPERIHRYTLCIMSQIGKCTQMHMKVYFIPVLYMHSVASLIGKRQDAMQGYCI